MLILLQLHHESAELRAQRHSKGIRPKALLCHEDLFPAHLRNFFVLGSFDGCLLCFKDFGLVPEVGGVPWLLILQGAMRSVS